MAKQAAGAALVLLAAVVLAIGAACDDGGAGNGPQPATPTESGASPTASGPTNTPSQSIRQVRFEDVQVLNEYIAAAGDVFIRQIRYIDLTEDNAEDAVINIASDGEGGDIAIFVFTNTPAGPEQLLLVESETSPLIGDVLSGRLVVVEQIFAPGDPMCCPSDTIGRVYEWNGSALVLTEEVER